MSGIEAVGLVASITQLGGLSAQLSIAPYNYVGTAVRADNEFSDLAGDIDTTCVVLASVKDVLRDGIEIAVATKQATSDAVKL